jgi:hypothetical protein
MSKKRSKKKQAKHQMKKYPAHVISTVPPEVVAAVAKVEPDYVFEEPHVLAAVPKTVWQKITEWLDGKGYSD